MSRATVPSKRPAEAQEAAWIADEDRFVLEQAKKKAAIRVKGARAQPIDWLTVTLAVIDPDRNPLDDELEDAELELVDPETVFEGLDDGQLRELEKSIDRYLALETSKSNRDYWNMMKTISKDRQGQFQEDRPIARGMSSVASDLDKLLGPKNLAELEKLEQQIKTKLGSDEPIDTDYWEHLLKSLLIYKAKAKLRKVSQSVVAARLEKESSGQVAKAAALKTQLEGVLYEDQIRRNDPDERQAETGIDQADERHVLDPEPLLRLRQDDRTLITMDEKEFAHQLMEQRQKFLRSGIVSNRKRPGDLVRNRADEPAAKRLRQEGEDAVTHANPSAFEREVARGLGDNEEIFTAEEVVETKNKEQWAHQYRPRKPKYFNRMIKGYEWNKYNQTHYDHENPPPRVVQGYKFNVFYPDLVEKTRAPTYRIERENGRKRGQTFAPAGEDDTCLIRFMAGPPYEDIAFRIVDREWDYSAKSQRGFRSSFDKGILQLHFQFKKIYYRK